MAVQRHEVYKCLVCGIVTEIVDAGAGEPVCCGQVMRRLDEKTADAAGEKHVPVVERVEGGIRVTVGSTPHPMDARHFIQWIEVIDGPAVYQRYLQPGDPPEAFFPVTGDGLLVRQLCNLHGLWRA